MGEQFKRDLVFWVHRLSAGAWVILAGVNAYQGEPNPVWLTSTLYIAMAAYAAAFAEALKDEQ